jgi:N-sulfoglucosamine sulfohydrolase
MVTWVDILPTLVEVAGGTPRTDLDGRSFAAVLRGEKTAHRDRIFATHSADGNMNVYPIRSLRTADWKFILNLHPEFQFTTHVDLAPRGDRKPGYWGSYWTSWIRAAETNAGVAAKVNRYHRRPAQELYDLRADPHEQNNLAADAVQANRVKEMRAELESWMQEQNDQRTVFGMPK